MIDFKNASFFPTFSTLCSVLVLKDKGIVLTKSNFRQHSVMRDRCGFSPLKPHYVGRYTFCLNSRSRP